MEGQQGDQREEAQGKHASGGHHRSGLKKTVSEEHREKTGAPQGERKPERSPPQEGQSTACQEESKDDS